jgi:hypothetical protein
LDSDGLGIQVNTIPAQATPWTFDEGTGKYPGIGVDYGQTFVTTYKVDCDCKCINGRDWYIDCTVDFRMIIVLNRKNIYDWLIKNKKIAPKDLNEKGKEEQAAFARVLAHEQLHVQQANQAVTAATTRHYVSYWSGTYSTEPKCNDAAKKAKQDIFQAGIDAYLEDVGHSNQPNRRGRKIRGGPLSGAPGSIADPNIQPLPGTNMGGSYVDPSKAPPPIGGF